MTEGGDGLIDRLALDLYTDVLDGAPMERPLTSIMRALGGQTGFATRVSFEGPLATPAGRFAQHGIDPDALVEYSSHWMPHDPWMVLCAQHGPGVINLTRLLPSRDYMSTMFWNEFAVRRGSAFHCLTVNVAEADDVTGVVALHRPRTAEAFGAAEESLLNALYPHLRRAVIAEARLVGGGLRMAAGAGLDAMTLGVAVLGPTGRLLHANTALLAMAAEHDGLGMSPNSLTLAEPGAKAKLDAAVRAALRVSKGAAVPGLTGAGFSAKRMSEGPPWRVQVLPLPPGRKGVFGNFIGVAILVTGTQIRTVAGEDVLRNLLGLTIAEAALAAGLATGQTLTDHARQRRVSIETVRSHMASIRRKTGCRRQSELVALVLSVAG